MTARFDSFQRSVAVFGALLFTAVLVFASTPIVPVA
jgi:hypothetical protein